MDRKQIDWTLIRKRIDGSLIDEERGRLERWVAGDERRKRFVEHACRYYERELPVADQAQALRAWQRFTRERRARKRHLLLRWTWSAAACLLLAVGSWFWWQGIAPRDVVEDMTPREIAIGSYRARLIISDGTGIHIAGGKSECTIEDKGVNVQLDSASLSYENNQVAEEIVYHTIEVPQGGEFQLTLSDGSRVRLNAESRMIYPSNFGEGERRVRLKGEAYFEVEPGKGRFVVESGGMDVRVLGTGFNVHAYDDEPAIQITLVHGKVEVLTAGDSLGRALLPGEQAVLDRESGELEVKQVNTDMYTLWTKGQFAFRDAPLKEIMRTLARWYKMDYEFADPGLESLCFYGVVDRFERVEGLLEQFEKTGKVHFECKGNKIRIKK